MIADFEDFCLWTYVVVDDLWGHLAPACARPGPPPRPSDPELITMILVGESCGWDMETELLARFREHRGLFPHLPERSRFNRRRRNLAEALNALRRLILAQLDLAADRQCVIDSLPVPVMQFHLVPSSKAVALWKAQGASFGKVPSKKQTIFGYKLHVLATLNGVIRDFVLAPAWHTDVVVAEDVLFEQVDLVVLGDKGYVSAPLAEALQQACRVTLMAVPRTNQRVQLPEAVREAVTRLRQSIETVNDQLTEQWHIDRNHAHSFWGLCARLHAKLAAHTLAIYLNRLTGQTDFRHLKRLAFPI